MLTNIVIAQIVGILAAIVFALAPHQRNKNKILIFQVVSGVLYSLQYLFLGAISAVATSLIGVVKDFVFFMYVKKGQKISIKMLSIYIGIIVLFGFLTYTNIFSILPILISIVFAYGIWQTNLTKYRIIVVITDITWIVYNFVVGAYVGVIANVIQTIIAIVAIIRLDILVNKIKNNTISER